VLSLCVTVWHRMSLCHCMPLLCAGFHDFFTNWVLHAREFGYDKHFLAVAEDAGSSVTV